MNLVKMRLLVGTELVGEYLCESSGKLQVPRVDRLAAM